MPRCCPTATQHRTGTNARLKPTLLHECMSYPKPPALALTTMGVLAAFACSALTRWASSCASSGTGGEGGLAGCAEAATAAIVYV